MTTIPKSHLDLLQGKHVAHLATKNPDGTLQSSIVWIDYDESRDEVVFNTARGRKKERNLDEGAPVSLSIQDNEDIYRYIAIQGTVTEIAEEGAVNHIDSLANRYFGRESYGVPEGETRIKIYIKPRHVTTSKS